MATSFLPCHEGDTVIESLTDGSLDAMRDGYRSCVILLKVRGEGSTTRMVVSTVVFKPETETRERRHYRIIGREVKAKASTSTESSRKVLKIF